MSHTSRALTKTIVTSEPFKKVTADIFEFTITSCWNRCLLVVQDYYSMYDKLYVIPDYCSTTVPKCLFENFICENSILEMRHTDQGHQLEPNLMKHLCELFGILKDRTSPYHPQFEGMIKRFNPHRSISQITQILLTHRHKARMPANLLLPNNTPSSSTPGSHADYGGYLTQNLQSVFGSTVLHVSSYVSGDLMWLSHPTTAKHKLSTLERSLWSFRVPRIQDLSLPGAIWQIHYNCLKPYKGQQIPLLCILKFTLGVLCQVLFHTTCASCELWHAWLQFLYLLGPWDPLAQSPRSALIKIHLHLKT